MMSFPYAHSGLPLPGSTRRDTNRDSWGSDQMTGSDSARAASNFGLWSNTLKSRTERLPVGIDGGVRTRFTLSSGHKIPRRRLARLRRLQQGLPAAKKGSNNRARVAGQWQRVRQADRDVSAVKNILQRGLASLFGRELAKCASRRVRIDGRGTLCDVLTKSRRFCI